MAEQCQVHGTKGAVAAAAPIAALIGVEAMRSGGNAYDAAVAALLAETVLLPPKCGLAGDLIALAWRRGESLPESLLAIGGAPEGLAELARRGELRPTGPTSVGVPGAPGGYLELAKRGKLTLKRLAEPAIELARNGFPWSRICSSLSEQSAHLVAQYNSNSRYFPAGRVIEPGTVVRLPGLADLLTEFVESRNNFLIGDVGEAILDCVNRQGGVLCRSDFRHITAEWTAPEVGTLGQQPLYVTPAPTHGSVLLRAVADLPVDWAYPAASILPSVMKAIDWQRQQLADSAGTSMVSAVDAEGTMITVVHSNSYPRFGSGLIVNRYDLILANRAGRGFSSDPNHPNFPAKGRRPATTLHAWAVRGPRGKRLQGATPGGANQMPWNAQTLARLVAGETDIGRLIAAPRWEWIPKDDSLLVERGFSEEEYQIIRATSARTEHVDRWATASAMQIIVDDPQNRTLSAAADPRTVGSAIAY